MIIAKTEFVLKLISRRRYTLHRLPSLRLLLHIAHLTTLRHIENPNESGNDRKKLKLRVLQKSDRGLIPTTIKAVIELKLGFKKGIILKIISSLVVRLGKISKPTHLKESGSSERRILFLRERSPPLLFFVKPWKPIL